MTSIEIEPECHTVRPVQEAVFRAMGSVAHVIVVGGSTGLLDAARGRIDELERRWSRFRADSEVCELNRGAGDAVRVSADTRLLVQCAIEAWRLTGGSFDPGLLGALTAAGYDSSFDRLRPDHPAVPFSEPPQRLRVDAPSVTDIVVAGDTVRLPSGFGFDPGGIGKGLAADLVASELIEAGATGACVNLGGDLRVIGEGPEDGAWTLAIDHSWASAPVALVGLRNGAIATSSVLRRTWTRGGRPAHHLIDPATLEPSRSDIALATVIAGEAWQAEVLAKAALLRGTLRAFDLLDAGCHGLVVDHSGRVTTSECFGEFTGDRWTATRIDFDLGEEHS